MLKNVVLMEESTLKVERQEIILNVIIQISFRKVNVLYKPVKLFIRIDESPQATNGKYDLKESIIEEFLYGITNFNYGCTFPPILYDQLKVKKPTLALILDDPTPLSDNKGLAPEIICRGITSAADKKRILEQSGMIVVDNIQSLKDELARL